MCTKWSLGIPPKILLENCGIIPDQPDSPVTLVYMVCPGNVGEIRVEVLLVEVSFSELLETNISLSAAGLGVTGAVSITTLAYESLQHLDFECGPGKVASVGYQALLGHFPLLLTK
jgi:hypothetical protein